MFRYQVMSYDVINMPPVSLIQNVRLSGNFYNVDGVKLPAEMQFHFS
jgi:CRISPR-associated protein Csc1